MNKINVKSPYYFDIEAPTPPAVEFTCDIANLKGLSIDQLGVITLPTMSYGQIKSYTSTDLEFIGNKFEPVTTNTDRTVSFEILIPSGFTNSSDINIVCDVTATQPALVCVGGITPNGTIPNQIINAEGKTVTIDLSNYFTAGIYPITSYKVDNIFPSFIQTSISGSILTITSLNIGGTKTINVEAKDGDLLTCDASQQITITINNLPTFDCTTTALSGGSITQTGTITKPISVGDITGISLSNGGTLITSVPANNGSTTLSVTLWFRITVPDGYDNEGTIIWCSKIYQQLAPATLPNFSCTEAGLTGQAVYQSGAILEGITSRGTIESYSPSSFDIVYMATPRTVDFKVRVPNTGWGNNGALINCTKVLTQPRTVAPCDGNIFSWNVWKNSGSLDYVAFQPYCSTSSSGAGTYKLHTKTLDATELVGNTYCFWNSRTYEYRDIPFGEDSYYAIHQTLGASNEWCDAKSFWIVRLQGSVITELYSYNNDRRSSQYRSATRIG